MNLGESSSQVVNLDKTISINTFSIESGFVLKIIKGRRFRVGILYIRISGDFK